MVNDHHAPNTPAIDMMTEEALADLILDLTQETEVQVTQDTPAQTDTPTGIETPDKGTHLTEAEFKVNHLTGSVQVAIDH